MLVIKIYLKLCMLLIKVISTLCMFKLGLFLNTIVFTFITRNVLKACFFSLKSPKSPELGLLAL